MDAHHRHHLLGLCCPCSSHGKPVGSPAVPRCFPLSQTCAHTSSQHTRDGARALWRLCRGRSCRGSSRFSCLWTRKGSWKIQSSPPPAVCAGKPRASQEAVGLAESVLSWVRARVPWGLRLGVQRPWGLAVCPIYHVGLIKNQ